jgi:hypothetical protein
MTTQHPPEHLSLFPVGTAEQVHKFRMAALEVELARNCLAELNAELEANLAHADAACADYKAQVAELLATLKELHRETLYRISDEDPRTERPSADLFTRVEKVIAKAGVK